MPYGRRPRLVGLDKLIIGAFREALDAAQDAPAADAQPLTNEQQTELYRLNYKAKAGTLSPAEAFLRHRLTQLARGRK